ncbi:hypothetical protein [Streptomyces sp. NPDC018031]|uniref:hypothetical protein n=1 Tax=Streptomyces sp. NPDC018031 TaxID=3365033 RepID=UPI003798ABBE
MGERLPSAPRERKPALAALAVLLILVGALGATVLVLRAGDRIEVVKITAKVTAGKQITEQQMTSVLVAEDSGIDYVKWEQRKAATSKYRAATDIPEGSLLVGQMLTNDANGGLPDGKVLVGLSLKAGQYPSDLEAGDVVAAYHVGDKDQRGSSGDSGSAGDPPSSSTPLVTRAKVVKATKDSGGQFASSDLPVSILVDQAQAGPVIRYASAGEVALAKVPPTEG